MKSESLTWHELPQDVMPDAEATVLISAEGVPVDTGWWDGEAWRWCESGGEIEQPVLGWADLPQGLD